MSDFSEKPLADPVYERNAHELFPFETMTPEEYAARNGHGWLMFSFGSHSYRDKKLEAWAHRLNEILSSNELMEQCRNSFLSPQERKQIEEEIQRMRDEF